MPPSPRLHPRGWEAAGFWTLERGLQKALAHRGTTRQLKRPALSVPLGRREEGAGQRVCDVALGRPGADVGCDRRSGAGGRRRASRLRKGTDGDWGELRVGACSGVATGGRAALGVRSRGWGWGWCHKRRGTAAESCSPSRPSLRPRSPQAPPPRPARARHFSHSPPGLQTQPWCRASRQQIPSNLIMPGAGKRV